MNLTSNTAKFAALKTAEGVLSGAQSILNGLGHNTSLTTLQSYQTSLDLAVQASNAALSAANSTLAFTITAQDAAIAKASTAVETAKNSSTESIALAAVNQTMSDLLPASTALISMAQTAVDSLASTVEGAAFTAATNSLDFANNNNADLDIRPPRPGYRESCF